MVLCYHGVREAFEPGISSVPVRRIAMQLDYLTNLGWTRGETAAGLPATGTLAVTLDDAFESQLERLTPLLSDRGFRTTLFVPAGWVGLRAVWDYAARGRRHASWSQLSDWCSAGHAIGSHGMWHRDLRLLSDSELAGEVVGSRLLLEDRLGVPVTELSYPFGRLNARVIKSVREAGYQRAFTTSPCGHDTDSWMRPRLVASCLDTPLSLSTRAEATVWGSVERGKQRIIQFWAGGTSLLPRRTRKALSAVRATTTLSP